MRGKQFLSKKGLWITALMILALYYLPSGCSSAPKAFNDAITGPQLIVDPDSVSLGVASLMDTDIVIRGRGFRAGEIVEIEIIGQEEKNQDVQMVISHGQTGEDGGFETRVKDEIKVFGLLNADAKPGKKGMYIIISQPAVASGVYSIAATGLDSDTVARNTLTLKDPGLIDNLMDSIGGMLGKIKKEE